MKRQDAWLVINSEGECLSIRHNRQHPRELWVPKWVQPNSPYAWLHPTKSDAEAAMRLYGFGREGDTCKCVGVSVVL